MSNTLPIEDHLMDRQSAYGQKISILNKDVLILAVSEDNCFRTFYFRSIIKY